MVSNLRLVFSLGPKLNNSNVANVNIKQLRREICRNTKGEYMKESNTLAANVTIKQLQREICLNTKREYTKE